MHAREHLVTEILRLFLCCFGFLLHLELNLPKWMHDMKWRCQTRCSTHSTHEIPILALGTIYPPFQV